MKRLIIVSIMLAICIISSAYTVHHVNEVTKFINTSVESALIAISSEDEERLLEVVDNLSGFWDGEEDRLLHLVRHAKIDDITKSVARLQALTIGKDHTELRAELASIRWQIDHINRSEQMLLSNLL